MFNPEATINIIKTGSEQFSLIIIDDFALHPEMLVEQACLSQFQSDPADFYPGIRAALPASYVAEMSRAMMPVFQEMAGVTEINLECLFNAWSLTTWPGNTLKPIQCIPHFDDTNPNKFAMVHYLFKGDLGGTSFFRHNKTGIEAITADNQQGYMKTLGIQATTEGLPETAYIQGSTRLFSEYHYIEPKFNRAIFYPSNILHSGIINPDTSLSENPKTGRLTANMALLLSR